ncbi:hypothetical protein ACFVFH_25205 [Streptomyces sp. NPDC057697]|uniref:hypothetical protein n=1 Tax=Streptomyces sp. NPDC057697 TaxID=3346219 RepID=UPI00369FCCE2
MNDVTTEAAVPDANPDANANPDVNPDANAGGNIDGGAAGTGLPVAPGRSRRVVLMVLPVVLVAGAVGGAAVYTRSVVDGADRSAGTSLWKEPAHKPGKDPAGDVTRGRASTGLSKLLLPVPSGYRLGPDYRELGNDGEQSGRKATAAMKQSARGLAGKQRRAYEERVDKLRIEGTAVRSYTADDNTLSISTQIMRMKDREAVRNLHAFRTGLFDSLGIFRAEPGIEGHKRNARCYVLREDSKGGKGGKGGKDGIESMNCLAYDGEVSISLTASGTRPFDRKAVAALLKDQLDHIKSPGEYV